MQITIQIPDECAKDVARIYGYKDTVIDSVPNPQSLEDFFAAKFTTDVKVAYGRTLESQAAAEARATAISIANKVFTPQEVPVVKEASVETAEPAQVLSLLK